jgi:hypothetical protein
MYGANQSGHLSLLWTPRKYGKGIEIRIQKHIGFLSADKALDGRSVKHVLIVQCPLQIISGNGNILQCAENICKLQADEFHVLFVYKLQNVLSGIVRHRMFLPFLKSLPKS